MNTDGAQGTDEDFFNDTNPTSSVFTVKNNYEVNYASEDYVAYCFAPVAGYSAFGKYTGNNSTNGPFVYTGFRPAFLIIKRTDSTKGWMMIDSTRNPDNVIKGSLFPHATDTEFTGSGHEVDFLSNGFKCRK